MYWLCAGSRFRYKIVCGDVFSSASDALFFSDVFLYDHGLFMFSSVILSNSCHRDH